MKNTNSRNLTIALAVITLAALLLLATSLSGLRLTEGKPLPLGQLTQPIVQSNDSGLDITGYLLSAFRVMMIIFWVLLPFYIIYLILSKEARKKLLRDLAMILPILILLYFISVNMKPQQATKDIAGNLGLDSSKIQENTTKAQQLPEFTGPPAWVTTATTIALSAGVTALIAGGAYLFWKRSRNTDKFHVQAIGREAQKAIDSIEAGGDLREVIQRCYLQMVEAVRDHRNINFDRDMTPSEFEQILEKRGLPPGPVQQLTVLFEQVRYGAFEPGRQEERTAINALSAIVAACQRPSARAKEEARL